MRLTLYADRFKVPASGIAGGKPGATGFCSVMRDGSEIPVRSKDDLTLREGNIVTLAAGGGGGWGQPYAGDDT